MKITFFLSMITVFQLWATETYSQLTKLNLNIENTRVADVLREIEDLSEFYFLYSPNQIDVERKVSIDATEESINDILNEIFANNVIFAVDERQIILTPNQGSSTPESLQQQQVITGTIIDTQTGEFMPGVNIQVKGTNIGAISDIEGKYSLSVTDRDVTLVFSFIGYVPQEISVSGKSIINIALSSEVIGLDEVVVIGYGTQRRRDVTGSVASLSNEKITLMPISRLDAALQGSVPGLDVVVTGHNPGDGSQILLRGRRSFSASNAPLMILDGIPYYGDIKDINPYDIVSIDVLKDASSTAIYGSRGANGVIIITTKRGESGKAKFSIDSYAGPTMIYGRIPYGTGDDYAARGREAFRATGAYPDDGLPHPDIDEAFFHIEEVESMQAGAWVDYQDMLFQNGFKQKHQLNVAGGTETVKYNITGNIYNEEGILPGHIFDRYSIRSNLDIALSKKFNIGSSILLSYSLRHRDTDDGAISQAYRGSPLGKPFEDDGTPRFYPVADGTNMIPTADYEFDSYRWDQKRWAAIVNFFADYQIIDGLKYRLTLGTDINTQSTKEFAGYYSIQRNMGTPIAGNDHSIYNGLTYESILTYDKFLGNDHHLTITAVHGIQTQHGETSSIDVSDLPYEKSRYHNIGSASVINAVGSDLREWALLSYVGRVFYSFKEKYLFTGSIRADGASQFSPNHKWGYFPSVALAWRLSEEAFMSGTSDWLNNLKLRLSYGVSGNQAIDPYVTQGGTVRTTYAWDERSAFGYKNSVLANKDLKWESTAVTNFGLDFAFIGGKINGNIEVYNTNTYDLLMQRQLPITTGYSSILENIGRTRNRGIEVGLNINKFVEQDFLWSGDYSIYLNREEIVELYAGTADDIGNMWFIGYPIHVYYDKKKIGIWQLDEVEEASSFNRKPGEIKVFDLDESGNSNDADRMILGDREPDFVFQTTQRISYKNLDFSATGYLRWGNMISVSAFNPHSKKRYNQLLFDYWTTSNPTNSYPRPNDNVENTFDGSTLSYRDGSFFKLRQVSIAYNLPKSLTQKISLSNAKLYLTAENPWYWTKSEMDEMNIDPEDDADIGTIYPAMRSFILGINISF